MDIRFIVRGVSVALMLLVQGKAYPPPLFLALEKFLGYGKRKTGALQVRLYTWFELSG